MPGWSRVGCVTMFRIFTMTPRASLVGAPVDVSWLSRAGQVAEVSRDRGLDPDVLDQQPYLLLGVACPPTGPGSSSRRWVTKRRKASSCSPDTGTLADSSTSTSTLAAT